jgi:hypothetical protein
LRGGMQPDVPGLHFQQIKCRHSTAVGSSKLILNDQY